MIRQFFTKLKLGQGGMEFVILMYIFMFSIAIPGTYFGWWR